MYHHFNRYKILRVFFDEPNKKFQLRELSRITKISLPSIKKHVEMLSKEGLIVETKGGVYKGFKSSFSDKYRALKRNDLLIRLEETGFLEELDERFTPDCIVLYGSGVEGMDDERGDIDIFVQCKEKNLDLKQYEKLLKRKISLLVEPNMDNISKNLKNSLINGIVLRGFLKVI